MVLIRRRPVTAEDREASASAAKELLIAHPLFQKAQSIACYMAQPDEFGSRLMIEEVWRAGKRCYLPVLSSDHLTFALYHFDTPLRLNRYHIAEPENTELLAADHLDLVIMPLSGFDLHGHRLGKGGGHYDRTFAFKREKPDGKPFLLGLGYQCQCVDHIPQDPWDVALDGVLTEQELKLFTQL
jgi:5-formyltetrahydrofolate cyclo-ligase